MKKTVRVLSIVIMVAMILSMIANVALAYAPSQLNTYISNAENGNLARGAAQIGGQIVAVIRVIGTIAALAILVLLGVKYMTASTEGKADIKSSMVPYLVGAILVFGGTWIGTWIYTSVNNLQI